MSITKEKKAVIIKDNAISEKDTGSAFVQVAVLTERINSLTEHMKANKKDFNCRLGLEKLVGRRKRLLAYLKENNAKAYEELIKKLGLRK